MKFYKFLNLKKEFVDAQLHVGKHECKSFVKDNVISQVECKERSTFEAGARGEKGVQVVVSQTLNLVEVKANINKMNIGLFFYYYLKTLTLL